MPDKTLPTLHTGKTLRILPDRSTTVFQSPLLRRRATTALATIGVLALSSAQGMAQAAGAGGNTLGTRMSAVAGDMTTGGGTLLTLFGFILGGFALLAGGWTVYQHTKNPNGQAKLGYGVAGVLAGGFFLTLASIAQFSSQTVSGAAASSDGTSKQMMFN